MHDFNSLEIVQICFLAQNKLFYGDYSMYTYKVHEVSFCWVEYSLSIYCVKLIDNVSPVFSVPNDFLFLCCKLLKRELKSPAIIVNLSISSLNSGSYWVHFEPLFLNAYTFRNYMSSCRIES